MGLIYCIQYFLFFFVVGELCELFCSCETIEIAPPIDNGTPCVNEDGTEGRCLGKLCAVSYNETDHTHISPSNTTCLTH